MVMCGSGCWVTDKDHEVQINKMLKQLDGFIGTGLSNTTFWQAQAIWQEGADSVIIGTTRNSSLLKDESESQVRNLTTVGSLLGCSMVPFDRPIAGLKVSGA